MIKKILKNIILILVIGILLLSCESKKIIDYDLEIVETTEVETTGFSFDKPKKYVDNSQVVTKRDKDIMVNDRIKKLVSQRKRRPVQVKGIYLPAYVAGKEEKFGPIFEYLKNSDLNAIVVDIKDELGRNTIENNSAIVKELKTTEVQIKNITEFIERCHSENIYVIARIACFLDNFATRQDSNMALRKTDGKLYKDNMGYYWLNPYVDKTRQYIKEIALSAADKGFDEIQFDYFRFSTDGAIRRVDFNDEMTKGKTKIEILTEFAQEVYEELIEKNVFFSIDVYGSIINSYKDQYNIGQDYPNLIKYCDYICPMIYPSHYANKTFGIEVPDTKPYETIYAALNTSSSVIDQSSDNYSHYGIVRPWLQAFTANWLTEYKVYGKDEYEAQINALEKAGYKEFLLWQGGGVYKWDELLQIDDLKKKNIQ